MLVKLVLTLAFLAVMVGVGVYSRKHSQSVDGFVLGGRNVGPWLTAFAYGTSYFSAVVFIGYAGQFGWKFGLSSTWIGIGNAVVGSLLAWLVLGRRTKLMTQWIKSRTMPDFFGTRYDSEAIRIAASVIAFVFLIPYTAGVYKGISTLFEMSFHIRYEYCVVLMAALTAVYVILGYDVNGIKDILGVWIGDSEGKHYWMQIFDEIKGRGVEDVLFISMDGVSGLEEGARSIFKDVIVQRCIVHLIRNSIKYIPSKDYKAFAAHLKRVYGASSLKAAEAEFERVRQAWSQ